MSRAFSYASDITRTSSASSSSSANSYSSSFPGAPPSHAMDAAQMDYTFKPRSRPVSIHSAKTTSSTSSTSSSSPSDDSFLNSGQTYSAYLHEQAAQRAHARAQAKKNVNVYTTCGRHSNEWLFSGWSFRRQ